MLPDAPPPVEFAFFHLGVSPPPPPAPLSVRVQHFPSTFYRAGINPRCRLRLILQLSLIQRIPWNVIITTVYLELLLSLSAFYTATRGEPWVSSASRELPRIVFERKGCNNRSCTVRWITMRDKLNLMVDDYPSTAIMYRSQHELKLFNNFRHFVISENFEYSCKFTTSITRFKLMRRLTEENKSVTLNRCKDRNVSFRFLSCTFKFKAEWRLPCQM